MNFINLHFPKIVIGLLLVIFMQECNTSSRLTRLEKHVKSQSAKLDSVCTTAELSKSLEAEGLRAEKRMIQSTDRTMLDVNRQSEIDSQLKMLEK